MTLLLIVTVFILSLFSEVWYINQLCGSGRIGNFCLDDPELFVSHTDPVRMNEQIKILFICLGLKILDSSTVV